jgi:hypothetical protein
MASRYTLRLMSVPILGVYGAWRMYRFGPKSFSFRSVFEEFASLAICLAIWE